MAGKTQRELSRLRALAAVRPPSDDYVGWRDRCLIAVESIYGHGSHQAKRFEAISFELMAMSIDTPQHSFVAARHRGIDRAVQMLLAFASEIEFELEDPTAPAADPGQLHPWVAGPSAALWADGHLRQAVQDAARSVDQRLQLKVGEWASGAKLLNEAFSAKPPTTDRPRLRFEGYAEGTDAWVSAHSGTAQFGAGCMMRIRNLYVHSDEPTEQEALEALAALSLLARWIDQATVVQASG